LGRANLAVLERYADPRRLVKAGRARLTAVLAKASNNHQGQARAEQWLTAAQQAIELYGITRRSRSPTSPPRSPPTNAIIAEQWTVPEDVRRRRRSRKSRAGKAPYQVFTGHDQKTLEA
jgi:hypothetical protein